MKINYYKLDPTGNITLLVGSPVEKAVRPFVALRLMELEPDAEQVGFVEGKSLNMAGGEFCGNASLSAAALYFRNNGIKNGKIEMTVSGAEKPVSIEIKENPDGSYSGGVTMPVPLSVGEKEFTYGDKKVKKTVVEFPGISHIITQEEPDKAEAERLIKLWCNELNADSLGIMFVNAEKKSLIPLVYVPAAGTVFWESSCASGTTAAGVYFAYEKGEKISLEFSQPGGILGVEAQPGKAPVLKGSVRIVGEGTAEISV